MSKVGKPVAGFKEREDLAPSLSTGTCEALVKCVMFRFQVPFNVAPRSNASFTEMTVAWTKLVA